jgi:hypothetical protein
MSLRGHLPTETPVTSRLMRKVEVPPQKVVAAAPAPAWDGPPLQGDDHSLDYHEDGYPRLPACLRRRAPIRLVVSNPAPDTSQTAESDGAAGVAAA